MVTEKRKALVPPGAAKPGTTKQGEAPAQPASPARMRGNTGKFNAQPAPPAPQPQQPPAAARPNAPARPAPPANVPSRTGTVINTPAPNPAAARPNAPARPVAPPAQPPQSPAGARPSRAPQPSSPTGVSRPSSAPPPGAEQRFSRSVLLPDDASEYRESLAGFAKKLHDEQLQARVKYFGPNQQTNRELDAITEAVIADLQALQDAGEKTLQSRSPAEVERELITTLKTFLDSLFSPRRKVYLRRKVEEIHRAITGLYFSSELASPEKGGESAEITWPDQAAYYAFKRHVAAIHAEFDKMHFALPGIREDAGARIAQFEKDLRTSYLARTTPELEKLLPIYRDVLMGFFKQLRKDLDSLCDRVVRESGIASLATAGYKLGAPAFHRLRTSFDHRVMDAIHLHLQEAVLLEARSSGYTFRDETLRFATDGRVYSEICNVVCDACYDFLHDEGFLELPVDWRAEVDRAAMKK